MSNFVRHTVTLLSANAGAQLINFLLIPLIARFYSPNEMGVLSLFLSVTGILMIFANGQYSPAIVLPKEEKHAESIFSICLFSNFAFTLLLFVICLLTGRKILEGLRYDTLIPYLYYMPPFVFFSALGVTFTYWYNRHHRFSLNATYTFSQGLFNGILKTVLGYLRQGVYGLINANIASQAIGLLLSFIPMQNKQALFHFRWNEMKKQAICYRNFPLYEMPHVLINMIGAGLPILILSSYFNMEQIGYFSMALTLGFRPLNLFSNSINQILYQSLSEKKNKKERMSPVLKSFVYKTTLVLIPSMVVLFFIMNPIVIWWLGSKWQPTVILLQIILPWLFGMTLTASLAFIPDLFAKQKTAMWIEIMTVILRLVAIGIGCYYRQFNLSIILYCFMSCLAISIRFIWYSVLIRQYEKDI